MYKASICVIAVLIACVILLMGGLMSFLSFSPASDLSEDLQQMQQTLGFGQLGGKGWYKPCDYIEITSPYGWRVHPITGEVGSFHNGVDLANDFGTPIYAAKNGTVVQVSDQGGYGNHVRIDHNDGLTTLYAHMQSFVVSEGDVVSGGQLIGYMGSTGNSTGPHLHFSVFDGTEYVDPMLYISEAALSHDAAERQIYQYLTTQVGLSKAAACGVLANMKHESDFNAHALGDDGTSYGLCQWHDTAPNFGRWTNLKDYCKANGLDDTELSGQLEFLHFELQTYFPGLLGSLKAVADTAEGAYDAAYAWCTQFEKPANMEQEGQARGDLAVTTYWPKYQGG